MNFTQSTNYYSNGKLLITGEYAVLNGALSLALPSSLGQKLIVQPSQNAFSWEAFDADVIAYLSIVEKMKKYYIRYKIYSLLQLLSTLTLLVYIRIVLCKPCLLFLATGD